jgi:hypothetical protein
MKIIIFSPTLLLWLELKTASDSRKKTGKPGINDFVNFKKNNKQASCSVSMSTLESENLHL